MALQQTARATVEIPVTCPRCNCKITARTERRFLNLDLAIEFKNYLNLYGIASRVRFSNIPKIKRTMKKWIIAMMTFLLGVIASIWKGRRKRKQKLLF